MSVGDTLMISGGFSVRSERRREDYGQQKAGNGKVHKGITCAYLPKRKYTLLYNQYFIVNGGNGIGYALSPVDTNHCRQRVGDGTPGASGLFDGDAGGDWRFGLPAYPHLGDRYCNNYTGSF